MSKVKVMLTKYEADKLSKFLDMELKCGNLVDGCGPDGWYSFREVKAIDRVLTKLDKAREQERLP